MSALILRDSSVRSLSTTTTPTFFTSIVATKGMTSMTISGIITITFGIIGLRLMRSTSLRSNAPNMLIFIVYGIYGLQR